MEQLRAAVHVVDITPHDFPGIRLGGFGFNRKATGILHPLQAGIVYLAQGDEEVALVTVDSVGLFEPWVRRIRDAITGLRTPDRALICSTHSHAAPDTMGYWGPSFLFVLPRKPGIEPGYMELLVERIAAGVDEAVAAARPARLRVGELEADPALFTNHRKGGAHDNRGVVLCLEGEDGQPMGTLLNFAAHPEGLWDKNKRVSPDYPHYTREVMREADLGHPVFFQGALGGMLTPDIPIKSPLDVREREVERIGRSLGESAVAAAAAATPIADPALRVERGIVHLPFANWRFNLARRLGIFSRSMTNGDIRTEANLVSLGDVRMLTMPGECLPEMGLELREVIGGSHPMVFCLGCDELGYILPHAQWDDKEYSYEITMSIDRDTAPKLVELARTLVARLD